MNRRWTLMDADLDEFGRFHLWFREALIGNAIASPFIWIFFLCDLRESVSICGSFLSVVALIHP
jgi:hypothetical protein